MEAKATIKAKAKAKAFPRLPLRSLVARFVQDLCKNCPRFLQMYWFASYWGLGHPLHPRGKRITVPKWSRARIPGWSLPVPLVFPRVSNIFRWMSKICKGFCKIQCLSGLLRGCFPGFPKVSSGLSRYLCGCLKDPCCFLGSQICKEKC